MKIRKSSGKCGFNEQLAHLTKAGMPVEQGLRLIAEDVLQGRMAAAVNGIVMDLDRGVPLAEAFERRKTEFPPLYSKLIAAGVKTNNLPGMLLNLGRHLDLQVALKNAIWRSLAYPLVIFVGFLAVMTFISVTVLPRFGEILHEFRANLPAVTEFLLWIAPAVPIIAGVIVGLMSLLPVAWHLMAEAGALPRGGAASWSIPGIGGVMRSNLIARWCDALQLGVEAGLGLPEAMTLAAEAVGSVAVAKDTTVLVGEVSMGRRLDGFYHLRVLPRTVVSAVNLGANQNDLPRVLENLVEMYRYQSQQQVTLLPGIMMPIFMLAAGAGIMVTIFAIFTPLVRLFTSVNGGE